MSLRILRATLACALLLLASVAFARSYTAGDKPLRSSWWYDPAIPGFAFTLSPKDDVLAGTLLTFDTSGEAVWYLVVGKGTGTRWTLPVTRHRAGNSQGTVVGSFTFEVTGERKATASWTIDGSGGNASLVPLELAPGYSAEDRSGHWFDPAEDGHGYTVYSQGDWQSLVHYGYDGAGNPRWVYADNQGKADSQTWRATYFRKPCASCDAIALDAGTIDAKFPLETEGSIALNLSLPAPLSGGFVRPSRPVNLLTDLPSGRIHPEALAQFADSITLTDYLRESVATNGPAFWGGCIDFSPAPAGAETSGTNTQEAGVDEADLIDSDGGFVYSIQNPYRTNPALRTMQLFPSSPDLAQTSLVPFEAGETRMYPVGLYYAAGSNGAPGRLVVVHTSAIDFCGPYIPGKVLVETYSLADRAKPARTHRVEIDGHLTATRRVGDRVVVVSNYAPSLPGIEAVYGPNSAAAMQRNEQRVADAPLAVLTPTIQVDGAARQPLVTPSTTWLPPLAFGNRGDRLVTVTTIPIDNPAAFAAVGIVDDAHMTYVSTDSVYLATSRYDVPTGAQSLLPPNLSTDIHRISLADAKYRTSGTVPGMPTASEISFAFSEHAGDLRVLTRRSWAARDPQHRLTVLREDVPAKRLVEIGAIPNAARPEPIGKPNEAVYGVRFVGNRGYSVTFERIDPLYVFDLSNPRDPRIAGSVELPGFSTYLHPVGETKLVGLGTDLGGGVKITLFDVGNPAAPRVLDELAYPRISSAALYEHRSVATLSRPDGTTRFTFPTFLYQGSSTSPAQQYKLGVRMIDVGAAALVDRGEIVQADSPTYTYGEQRTLLADDAIYTYLDGTWIAAPWGNPGAARPAR